MALEYVPTRLFVLPLAFCSALKVAHTLTPEIREKGEKFWKTSENAQPNADTVEQVFTKTLCDIKRIVVSEVILGARATIP